MFDLLVSREALLRMEPRLLRGATAGPAVLLPVAEAMPAGPGRMSVLAEINPLKLSEFDRVTTLVLWEQYQSWLAAQHAAAVDAVAQDDASTRVSEGRRETAHVTLTRAGVSARRNLATARVVAQRRSVRERLESGEVSLEQVHAVVQETLALDRVTAGEVIDEILAQAGTRTPSALRKQTRAAAIAADPATAELQAEQEKHTRAVRKRPGLGVGQAALEVTGPAEGIATIWTALDRLASVSAADDTRTLDQRRFDALVDLAAASLTTVPLTTASRTPARPDGTRAPSRRRPGRRRGLRPTVFLYADARTWAGLADNPVDVDGFGPIPAGQARALFSDAAFRVVVTDTISGVARAVSTRDYRPPARLRRLLHITDRTCGFPGCGAAVWYCDVEHSTPHDQGGATDTCNCGLVCRRHHRLKTFTGWRWQRQPDDRITWTSPDGHHYDRDPVRYLADHQHWRAFEQHLRDSRAAGRRARDAATATACDPGDPNEPPPF